MFPEIIPITDLQQQTRKYIELVQETGEPIVITQRGRAAAVLASAEVFQGYLATIEEKAFPDAAHRLERAKREIAEGKTIELESFLRKEAKRREAKRRKVAKSSRRAR